jgi:hypothetical protein
VYIESEEELDRYNHAWTHLLDKVLGPAESAAMFAELAEESP